MCRRIIFAGLFAPLLLLGCQSDQVSEDLNSSPDDFAYIETFSAQGLRTLPSSDNAAVITELQQAHLNYAFSDYAKHASTDVNFVSAPLDQQQLVAMLALGADGTTLQAVSDASGFDLTDVAVHFAISDWDLQINAISSVEQQRFLWGQQRYIFSAEYLQNQAELFGPTMVGLDFQAASYLADTVINEALSGLDLTEFDDRSRLVVAQTSQLDAAWSQGLSVESMTGRFAVLEDDEQRWVDMMRISGMMNVIEADDYRAVEVPLADSELSLLLIMPEIGGFENLRSRFDQAFLHEQLERFAPAQTTLMVPVFDIVQELSGNELPDLGVALVEPGLPEPALSGSQVLDVVFDENGIPVLVFELNDEGVLVLQDTANDEVETVPLEVFAEAEAEVVLDTVANFSAVNDAGYLYLLPPQQQVDFSVGQVGINSLTASAVVHQATENEPDYLFSNSYGSFFSAGSFDSQTINLWLEKSCFYPPDQRPFLFAVYARQTQTLLHVGHVVTLSGAKVEPDWTVSSYSSCGVEPPVQVFKHTEAVQCESGSGISLADMEASLINAGIEVFGSNVGHDGLVRAAVCGAGTGDINIFTVYESDVSLAESLGFHRESGLALE